MGPGPQMDIGCRADFTMRQGRAGKDMQPTPPALTHDAPASRLDPTQAVGKVAVLLSRREGASRRAVAISQAALTWPRRPRRASSSTGC
jgi:hypothetical protein